MKEGLCKINGLLVMEGSFRGPEHPEGPNLQFMAAYAIKDKDKINTCGKISLRIDNYRELPVRVRELFEELISTLETHLISDTGLFEANEEVIYAAIPERLERSGAPEEF